jgi:hypothetical protein
LTFSYAWFLISTFAVLIFYQIIALELEMMYQKMHIEYLLGHKRNVEDDRKVRLQAKKTAKNRSGVAFVLETLLTAVALFFDQVNSWSKSIGFGLWIYPLSLCVIVTLYYNRHRIYDSAAVFWRWFADRLSER